MNIFKRLIDRIETLERTVAEQARLIKNLIREGEITEVFDDGTVIVNAQDLVTNKSPFVHFSGAIKEWTPPSVGQSVIAVSPSGDPKRSIILPAGYSDAHKQPHNSLSERKFVFGSTTMTMTEDGWELEGTTITMNGNVEINGNSVTHNGTEIGDKHKHLDVVKGKDKTGTPV
ncbi:hypothetical protein GCM10007094_23880 [Pseudovibrio japonicus]|uniref:Phage baseplate assembly protein V n=1 Tax=Pseudovibrio japonicus TaxID=366534 RepID=A0ABQ3EL11_9HYPH|nr:phage baseplate assembly protein V [Pseudovibrio japonicus]GHB34064.1 hypothetical protein GCM10007094_23880 [Pseudovibrio japonicus]